MGGSFAFCILNFAFLDLCILHFAFWVLVHVSPCAAASGSLGCEVGGFGKCNNM